MLVQINNAIRPSVFINDTHLLSAKKEFIFICEKRLFNILPTNTNLKNCCSFHGLLIKVDKFYFKSIVVSISFKNNFKSIFVI